MSLKTPNHQKSAMRCPVDLEDVDLFSEGAQEHWYEAYEILHRDSPVHRIPGEGLAPGSDGFILTKHEDISRVVRDPARFPTAFSLRLKSIIDSGQPPEEAVKRANLMEVSMTTLRPTQELYRQHRKELTDPWVGPGSTRHKDMITECVDGLIDGWIDDGEVEFIQQFARPLPQQVMARVLGFPVTDVAKLEAWGNAQVIPFVHGRGHRMAITKEQAAQQRAELAGFQEYILDHVSLKRDQPQDDMISFLCEVSYQALERRLTDLEIAGIVYAMILGGLETTQYALEEQAQLLCEDPSVLESLRAEPSKLRTFIEEAMRLRAPTQGLSTRFTTQPEVFQGTEVPAGSLLHLRFGAANVDADEFECPHQVDLERKGATRHLAFSAGPRVCPGATLSRLEQQIAWTRLLERVESFETAPGNDFMHQPGIMLGTLELRLRFQKAAL